MLPKAEQTPLALAISDMRELHRTLGDDLATLDVLAQTSDQWARVILLQVATRAAEKSSFLIDAIRATVDADSKARDRAPSK